ncbi:MAG: hypothetical protein KF819_09700 [Labilithrix sp.]|nr:hypothetical protein [Labilithrix sp.]
MSFRTCLVTLLVAAGLAGCAAPAGDAGDDETGATADAVRSREDLAGAFAVQYAGLGGRFRSIARRDLIERLPAGEARDFATCLAERRDVVRGATIAGATWTFERSTYFMLEVELEPSAAFADPVMAFVFYDDGRSAFQALAWDRKRSVKLDFRNGSPCPAPAAEP